MQFPLVQVLPDCAEMMLTPGAAMSGLSVDAPAPRRGPLELNDAIESPASAVGKVTLTTLLAASCPLMALPVAWETRIAGMSTGPAIVPLIPAGSPGALSATRSPIAPAARTF